MRDTVHPVCVGFAENPNPGSDGTTTSNESAASAPNEAGSVSGPISFRNSTIEPGHPCVSISGIAPGLLDLTWMKWMSSRVTQTRGSGPAQVPSPTPCGDMLAILRTLLLLWLLRPAFCL